MISKKWIKIFLLLSFLTLSSVMIVNYSIDPLWSFKHTNKFNAKQLHFNERQQKTNNVYFNGLSDYNGILFGSSRSTFINQNDFHNMKIYNYALDSMYPFEYEEYLNLAKESKGKDFEYIIIGADFYNSMQPRVKRFENPKYYIDKTKSFLYRYKMLVSVSVLKRSLRNFKMNLLNQGSLYYSRDNVKHRVRVSEEERVKAYTVNLRRHTENFLGNNYQHNPAYKQILQRLKVQNPNTKFIIFTSPITADLLVSIMRNGEKMKEFEKWLHDIIEVFGEVNHFMTINSVTKNLQNYPDDDHYYPSIAKLFANKLSLTHNQEIPEDFGITLNKSNIDAYMKVFKEQIKNYPDVLKLTTRKERLSE